MTDLSNPYLPPQSDVEPAPDDRPAEPASKGRRFGTLVVDYLMYMVFSFCVGLVAVWGFGAAGMRFIEATPEFLLGLVLITTYYLFFEGLWGRTPGKFLFGTVVVSETGGRPRFGQVLGRTLCRFIPFEAFSAFGERPWHDRIPKTRVVRVRR